MPPGRGPAPVRPALPGVPLEVVTADGERLAAWYVPGPAGAADAPGVLVAHGFTGSLAKPAVQVVARRLAAAGGVLLIDLRGHGASTGLSTLGDREALDVDAGVAALRSLGHRRVVTTGWSMGGSAVLRQAGLAPRRQPVHGHPVLHRPDAVVAVSTASRWYATETEAMQRLHLAVQTRLGRRVVRHLGARVDPRGWDRRALPVSPTEAVAALDGTPLLVVHGDSDHYFPVDHPEALVAASGGTAELWLLPGFGHAEAAAERDPALLDRLAAHLPALLARAPRATRGAARRPEPARAG